MIRGSLDPRNRSTECCDTTAPCGCFSDPGIAKPPRGAAPARQCDSRGHASVIRGSLDPLGLEVPPAGLRLEVASVIRGLLDPLGGCRLGAVPELRT